MVWVLGGGLDLTRPLVLLWPKCILTGLLFTKGFNRKESEVNQKERLAGDSLLEAILKANSSEAAKDCARAYHSLLAAYRTRVEVDDTLDKRDPPEVRGESNTADIKRRLSGLAASDRTTTYRGVPVAAFSRDELKAIIILMQETQHNE